MEKNHQNPLQDIHQSIVLETSIEKVWEAAATSEGIASWFMPNQMIFSQSWDMNSICNLLSGRLHVKW